MDLEKKIQASDSIKIEIKTYKKPECFYEWCKFDECDDCRRQRKKYFANTPKKRSVWCKDCEKIEKWSCDFCNSNDWYKVNLCRSKQWIYCQECSETRKLVELCEAPVEYIGKTNKYENSCNC